MDPVLDDRVESQVSKFYDALFDGEVEFTTLTFDYATDGVYSVSGEVRGENQGFHMMLMRDD